jgi:plastocyanin
MKLRKQILLAALLGVESIGVMFGGSADASPPATQPASEPAMVKIDNFTFIPQTLTVSVGTRVTWVNRDDSPHTATSTQKVFSSKALDTDDQFSFSFTRPGTYAYFCAIHPHMTGRIIVTAHPTTAESRHD